MSDVNRQSALQAVPQPRDRYDVVIVGGGHAGAEAAWAAANMLLASEGRVALVTLRLDRVGAMSCNPAIGGLAKGQMVREVDAMGGLMGLVADATGIQFKVLNQSKGPAVRGPRCQSDKHAYAREVQRLLATRPDLDLIEGSVERLIVEAGRCTGVAVAQCLRGGREPRSRLVRAGAVVLTTGTFMRGLMHTGAERTAGGRVGEAPSVTISDHLRALGFELGRLKTGTPPRLAAESIDFDALEVAAGDTRPTPFSELSAPADESPSAAKPTGPTRVDALYPSATRFPVLPQVDCWITRTSEAIHDRIRENLHRAPMYNGSFDSSAGPRYCPSIEDKVVRFADKTSHHVFLEPESHETNEIYCNGISTSLPADVQDFMVRRMPGCERAVILRHGYAVEYDMVWPHQIDVTGMTKRVPGLFLAGQINGTSGYEEAAGQGLIAGVNAVLWTRGESQRDGIGGLLRLGRDRAYIGVLMDDLVTKTPREPYRMFTSRAEHRLVLRADNADQRLTPLARELGLIDDDRWERFNRKREQLARLREAVRTRRVADRTLEQWARRPGTLTDDLRAQLRDEPTLAADEALLTTWLAELQYEGYIERHRREAWALAENEALPLPTDADFDYHGLTGLRPEAAERLNHFRPATLGQAGRIAGVNPADLMLVRVAMSRAVLSG